MKRSYELLEDMIIDPVNKFLCLQLHCYSHEIVDEPTGYGLRKPLKLSFFNS